MNATESQPMAQLRHYATFDASRNESKLPLLPRRDESSCRPILIVVLTTFPPEAKQELEGRVGKCLSLLADEESIKANAVYVYADRNRTAHYMNAPDTLGCSADLYSIAVDAKDLGWDSFIVVDSYGKLQLTGRLKRFNEPPLEAIILATNGPVKRRSDDSYEPLAKNEERGVTARRICFEEALRILARQDVPFLKQVSGKNPKYKVHTYPRIIRNVYVAGAQLHCSNMPPMTGEAVAHKARYQNAMVVADSILKSHKIPAEIREVILKLARDEYDINQLSAAPLTSYDSVRTASGRAMTVYSLVQLSEIERNDFEVELSQSTEIPSPVVLYNWNGRHGTRQDIARLIDRQICENEKTRPGASGLVVRCFYPELWREKKRILRTVFYPSLPYFWSECSVDASPNELEEALFLNPELEVNTLPWLGFHPEVGPWNIPELRKLLPQTVLPLTNKLSRDEMGVIAATISTGAPDRPIKMRENVLPWHSNEDGSLEDMWNMLGIVYVA